ncbi:hypothetical protein D1007_29690 [Hordeum vulgare]|nr:hypothetical protein D1007_29690 [Hordeum vulgare]
MFLNDKSVLFRGGLHWHRLQYVGESNMIVVFDTTAESFRWMRAPVVSGTTLDGLFEMDGMLGMSCFNDTATSIDIWVLQDYESEVWTFKCHIELPLAEIRTSCGKRNDDNSWEMVVVPGDGELLVLVKFPDWLIQVDMDGKLESLDHYSLMNDCTIAYNFNIQTMSRPSCQLSYPAGMQCGWLWIGQDVQILSAIKGLEKFVYRHMVKVWIDLYSLTDKYTDGWLSSFLRAPTSSTALRCSVDDEDICCDAACDGHGRSYDAASSNDGTSCFTRAAVEQRCSDARQ